MEAVVDVEPAGEAASQPPLTFINYAPEAYDELLEERVASTRRMFKRYLTPNVETEVHPSPSVGYRQRLGLGVYDAKCPGAYRKRIDDESVLIDGLTYVYWDSAAEEKMVPIKEFGIAAEGISRAMPLILPFVAPSAVLREALRSVKFHTTLKNDQLTIAMIYGPMRTKTIDDEAWKREALRLADHVSKNASIALVSVFGREKGALVLPEGCVNYVTETLPSSSRRLCHAKAARRRVLQPQRRHGCSHDQLDSVVHERRALPDAAPTKNSGASSSTAAMETTRWPCRRPLIK